MTLPDPTALRKMARLILDYLRKEGPGDAGTALQFTFDKQGNCKDLSEVPAPLPSWTSVYDAHPASYTATSYDYYEPQPVDRTGEEDCRRGG